MFLLPQFYHKFNLDWLPVFGFEFQWLVVAQNEFKFLLHKSFF